MDKLWVILFGLILGVMAEEFHLRMQIGNDSVASVDVPRGSRVTLICKDPLCKLPKKQCRVYWFKTDPKQWVAYSDYNGGSCYLTVKVEPEKQPDCSVGSFRFIMNSFTEQHTGSWYCARKTRDTYWPRGNSLNLTVTQSTITEIGTTATASQVTVVSNQITTGGNSQRRGSQVTVVSNQITTGGNSQRTTTPSPTAVGFDRGEVGLSIPVIGGICGVVFLMAVVLTTCIALKMKRKRSTGPDNSSDKTTRSEQDPGEIIIEENPAYVSYDYGKEVQYAEISKSTPSNCVSEDNPAYVSYDLHKDGPYAVISDTTSSNCGADVYSVARKVEEEVEEEMKPSSTENDIYSVVQKKQKPRDEDHDRDGFN